MRFAKIITLFVLAMTAGAFTLSATGAARSASTAATCGLERWNVKTLQDGRADEVNFHSKKTTVSALIRKRRPSRLRARNRGVETTTYRLRARLMDAKLEDDSDVHLVISDPAHVARTMIVEFPDSGCVLRASKSARLKMRAARRALVTACGTIGPSSFRHLAGTATITGVGFFDFKHGQRGVAPNAIELHPVLQFRASDCS